MVTNAKHGITARTWSSKLPEADLMLGVNEFAAVGCCEVKAKANVWYAANIKYVPVASSRAIDFTVHRNPSPTRASAAAAATGPVSPPGNQPSAKKSTRTGALHCTKSVVVYRFTNTPGGSHLLSRLPLWSVLFAAVMGSPARPTTT